MGGGIRGSMKNDEVGKRLRNIEGHLKGVIRMVEEEAYCIDVIRQVQAIQASLVKVNNLILDYHLNSCVIIAVKGDDVNEREKVLNEIVDVFNASQKN
jgi:CsoR family transcriptional regulator, copper-sensing transcriptional repressor